jgi:hypothetical protein
MGFNREQVSKEVRSSRRDKINSILETIRSTVSYCNAREERLLINNLKMIIAESERRIK